MKRRFTFLLTALLLLTGMSLWGQSDYSTTYTSNITLSTTGGTSASNCKVIISDVQYDGIKAGTSSVAGACKLTVPAGTQYLHLHVAAWRNDIVTLTVTLSGLVSDIALTSNNGISNNSPFTFDGDPSSEDYYKVLSFNDLTEDTELTFTATSGKRFVLFGVNNESSGAIQTVATPTFSPAGGTYGDTQTVSISCSTDGATIYYTTDGSDPISPTGVGGTPYTQPLTISETTTVKAIATKDDMNNSAIASATYTIQQLVSIDTIPALWDLAAQVGTTATPVSVTFNNWYVTGIKGGQAIISDGQHGFVIYQSGHGFTAGDMLNGTVTCNALMFQNHYAELTGVYAANLTVTSNQEMPMLTTTIGALEVMNYGTPIDLGTLIYNDGQFYDETGLGITPYNNFNLSPNPVESLEAGKQYHVKGISIIYWPNAGGQTQQIAPRSAADFEEVSGSMETVATPTFSPAAGTYTEAQTVTIACETEGATIHYTLDGNDPTPNNAVYSTTITISETTTVKAVAVKTGMNDSQVATATYTISNVPSSSDYIRIAELSQLDDGAQVIFAARYNDNANEYYAMTAQASGKPTGVLFTSVQGADGETVPSSIADEASTYYWTVTTDGTNYTFANANGDAIGYTTSTNFAAGGDNTTWTIEAATSAAAAMVPEYSAFVITNTNVTNRAFALNSNHNFGPYNTQNIEGSNYNFFLDIFTTASSSTPICATPTFSPAAGTYYEAQTVSIVCATDSATIYYTVDGSDPTPNSPVYADPIAISETTTVKAFASKEGMTDSGIATATYTIQASPSVMTIAQARALAIDEYGTVQGVVTFLDGRNVYIQDTTAGIDLFLNSNTVPTTLAIGDKVQAYGKRAVYNGLVELSGINGGNADQFSILSSGNTLPLAVKTIAEILADYSGTNMLQSTRVKIEDAVIGAINTSGNTSITQDQNTMNIYKIPTVDGLLQGDNVTVTGIIGCFNAVQLRVNSASDVEFTHPQMETVATPTFSPAAGTYYETQTVSITCTTEGATIYYTLDGTEPTPNSTVYSTAITISETTTVKAMATKEGMTGSEIATAVYTITDAPVSSDYIRIAELSQLGNGAQVIFAARYNDNANEYYAMTAQASGKPTGVLFTSVQGTDGETVPSSFAGEASTYYWTVTTDGTNYTFTNANGDVLGYASSTNFATGGENTAWAIEAATSAATAMVPEYNGFVISNVNNTVRAIALNSNHNFGPYHTQNIGGEAYNFFIDLFATAGSGTPICAMPTFSPAAGTYYQAQTVSIACATEGATIYYTLDGSDPTPNSPVYADPISISETTTVKAFASKEGMTDSNIATATYTIQTGPSVITIAEARALPNDEYALVQGVVTFLDGRNVYIQDNTAGIDLFLNSNTVPTALAIGDMVQAYGKRAEYNGLVELSGINGGNADQFSILSNGNTLPLAVKTIAEILADYSGTNMLQSTRVKIEDAVIGAINTSGNTPITQGQNTMNIYKIPTVDGLLEGDSVTVTGIIGCFNAVQLRVNSASDVEYTHPQSDIVATPTFSPAAGTYYETQTVSIACATEGATIRYTLDGTDPTPNSTVYSAAITISETTTVKAMATKEGLTDSGIATAVYTITDAPVSSDYIRIADLSQLGNGSQVILAARYNDNTNEYYAMTAQASGKPTGVLFTSVPGNTGEAVPSSIADEASTYYWIVTTDGTNYTFTNANGDVLGYASSTNFATGGENTAWAIEAATSAATAMVPEYNGFVISNVNNTVRAIALNSNHNFGPYHTQNLGSDSYNFFLDIFATDNGSTPICGTPTFNPAGGTYYETQMVSITCGTAGATIHYTLDGSDPTPNSTVYSEPIMVSESMTIKAIAMKEGFDDSNIATAEYTIILGAVTIFFQDWEGEMNGWTFVTVEGNKPWTIGQYQGNHYANANGFNGGANEQWCISPAFNLNIYSNASLTFMNAMKFTGPDMEVFFSNNYDGENPTTATWTALDYVMSEGNYVWTESGTIDLADFTGNNCYIGFKYTSTENEAASWEIDDITLMGFTTDPYLTVTPTSLTGFTHVIDQGPSASQSFTLTAGNIVPAPGGSTGSILMQVEGSDFEISLDNATFTGQLSIDNVTNLAPTTVYVRMNGTTVGQHNASVGVYASSGDEATVTLSGTVTEQGQSNDWTRIYALSDLHDGDQVIIASRYDATIGDGYYAMTAGVSGKPDGVLFTSVNNNGAEILPANITNNADTYLWNVTLNGNVITLTNAAGDALGYSSSTNFAGNTSIDWTIAYETASEGAMIPNYTGFVITNAETTNRCIVMNASHKFGAYHTNNLNSPDYNFYLDLFVQGGTTTPTVATPVFSMASGTYYEEIDVEITCSTQGATIYYTTDGTDPTSASEVYTEAIHVGQNMTIKAIAMKEGLDNSGIATANYVINTSLAVIFNQDWEGDMEGWTFVTVEGNKPWIIGTYAGNKYANANAYGDDVNNEQWCISPSFNLNDFANQNVTLSFMNATKFEGPALELYFSNDYNGQDPTNATWQPLSYIPSEGNYTWTSSGEISLNGFNGSICYIGFRYISTVSKSAAAWEIDDILLTADMGNTPYLTATPNALSGFQHTQYAGPSAAQSFVVTGGNLSLDENVVSLSEVYQTGFEMSLDGQNFYSRLELNTVNGTLEPTTIYVRLNGQDIGVTPGLINISFMDITTTVALEGEVLDPWGIGDILAENVHVWSYDNQIVIENNCGNDLNMTVFNILGQPVMTKHITTGSINMEHHLSCGLYIITLSNNQGVISHKMVVK